MATIPSTATFPGHIRALDGLRGLAVLAVMVHHLTAYARADLPNAIYLVSRFGWAGVDLFFVLSGFLITGILWDNRSSRHRLRAFYGRRFLRIVPVYYVVILVYAAIIPLIAAPMQVTDLFEALPWHMAYLTNFRAAFFGRGAGPANTGHFWTLAVEEQFYLLWPAIVWVAARGSSPRETLMRFCVGLVAVALILRMLLIPISAGGAFTLLFSRMDSLAIGAFIALWARGPRGRAHLISKVTPTLVIGTVALVIVSVLSAGHKSYLHPLQQSVGFTLWAVFFGCTVVLATCRDRGPLIAILESRSLVAVGKISYGLYLIHYPMIFVLHRLGFYDFGSFTFIGSVFISSFALAWLSWRFFETPILRLKRHFRYETERSSTQAQEQGHLRHKRTALISS